MWPASDPAFSLAAVTGLGWIWGSFLNQLIDRAPYREPGRPTAPGLPRPPGLFTPPRSCCLQCGRAISWHLNLPVVSWLWLKGRCAGCGAEIGVRTLVIETLTPIVFAGWHGWQIWAMETCPKAELAGYAALSWLLVTAPRLLEGRRTGYPGWIIGLVVLPAPFLLRALC